MQEGWPKPQGTAGKSWDLNPGGWPGVHLHKKGIFPSPGVLAGISFLFFLTLKNKNCST